MSVREQGHCWHIRQASSVGNGTAIYTERCCWCGTDRRRTSVMRGIDPEHGPHVEEQLRETTQIRGGHGPCGPRPVAP